MDKSIKKRDLLKPFLPHLCYSLSWVRVPPVSLGWYEDNIFK
jgi:hypothetical protein